MAKRRRKDLQTRIPARGRPLTATGADPRVEGYGNVVAARGGIAVGGDFNGTIYQGAAPKDDTEALAIYRRKIMAQCRYVPMPIAALAPDDATAGLRPRDLAKVYVDLQTEACLGAVPVTSSGGSPGVTGIAAAGRRWRGSLLQAAALNHRLVVLGDPGSGKTTFARHLCLCLAANALEPREGWAARLIDWPAPERELLPVPIFLGRFSHQLPDQPGRAQPRDLWELVARDLRDQNLGFLEDRILKALDAGAAIVVVDGFDELGSTDHRRFVRDALQVFAERYENTRIVVTARPLSYQDNRWRLPDFPAFTVVPFDEQQTDELIAAWFPEQASTELVEATALARLTRGLRAAVRRPDLRALASNPLLLTLMAVAHAHRGGLPEARSLLYEDAMDLLLWRWDRTRWGSERDPVGLDRLLREAQRTELDLKRALSGLAFEAHRQGAEGGPADISEVQLQNALRAQHADRDLGWVGRMIDALRLRTGLLQEREPNVYRFLHHTLQEHLASVHLAASDRFAVEGKRLAESGGTSWWEVILLAVGRLVHQGGDTYKPLALAAELCPAEDTQSDPARRRTWLAGEVLVEAGVGRIRETDLGRGVLERVRSRLARVVDSGTLTAIERSLVGVTLGRMGDPRPGVGTANGLPELAWVEIPAGPFPMGHQDAQSQYASDALGFTCGLVTQPYRISRYPVTVAQYQAFVDAGGYGDAGARYWTPEGLEWKVRQQITCPEDYDPVFQTPNHPRVGVSWYEAVAFCAWLSAQLNQNVGLPTEAQWERAARHTDGRSYPWGEAGDDIAERCNQGETMIGYTSAVGMFPRGVAECGAADLAGNVWEWCRTKWLEGYRDYEVKVEDRLDGEEARVLRGGAFQFGGSTLVRCAYRSWNLPEPRYEVVGFRVVESDQPDAPDAPARNPG